MGNKLMMEVVVVPVKASASDQAFGQQTEIVSGKVVSIAWFSRMTFAPDGTPSIGTTSANAVKGCYLTLKEGKADRFNKVPLALLDPDFRLGKPWDLPEPVVIDWQNSKFRFANAAHVTAGEALVLHVWYQP